MIISDVKARFVRGRASALPTTRRTADPCLVRLRSTVLYAKLTTTYLFCDFFNMRKSEVPVQKLTNGTTKEMRLSDCDWLTAIG